MLRRQEFDHRHQRRETQGPEAVSDSWDGRRVSGAAELFINAQRDVLQLRGDGALERGAAALTEAVGRARATWNELRRREDAQASRPRAADPPDPAKLPETQPPNQLC
jgi:hypothetical protein